MEVSSVYKNMSLQSRENNFGHRDASLYEISCLRGILMEIEKPMYI